MYNKKIDYRVTLILLIIVLNYIFDITTGILFSKGSLIAIVRAIFLYIIIFYLYLKENHIIKYNTYIFLLLFQTLIMLPISNNYLFAIQSMLKIFAPILLYPISIVAFNTERDLKFLAYSVWVGLFLLFLNFIISIFFNLGLDVYNVEGSFHSGNMYDNWNVYTYSLFYIPLIFYFLNKKANFVVKSIVLLISIFDLLVLFLSMKRTAMFGTLLGFVIIFWFYNNKTKILKLSFYFILILTLLWPYYSDLFYYRLSVREGRFEAEAIEKDARYNETFFIVDEVFNTDNVARMFFGSQVFNSPGNYASGELGDRPLHVDYYLIIHGHGLIGIILYLLIFYKIYRDFKKYWKFIPENNINKIIKPLFYTLLIVPFFTSIGGQITGITFRTLIFVGLGACVGYSKYACLNIQNNNQINYENSFYL